MPELPKYSPFFIRWAIQWGETHGLLRSVMLCSTGICNAVFTDFGTRVPGDREEALLVGLRARLGPAALPASMALQATPGELDLYGLYPAAGRTVAEALKRLAWVHRLLPDTHRIILKPQGRLLSVGVEAVLPQWDRPALATLRVGFILALVREVGGRDLRPRRVNFRMPCPHDRLNYQRLAQASVHFLQPTDEIILDIACLERPGQKADPGVSRVAKSHLLRHFGPNPRPQVFPERLYEEVERTLRRRNPCLAEISEYLGVAPRTLQHNLQQYGMTFQELLDARRNILARKLLIGSRLSVAGIATRLGFGDVRSLQKAFHRWEGLTPQRYRQLAQEPPGDGV